MSTGINNTVRWTLEDGVLTITAVNGVSGVARAGWAKKTLFSFCTGMTDSEWNSVRHIVYEDSVAFENERIGGGYDRQMPTIVDSILSPNTNVETVDVSGLNTVGVESFYCAFAGAVNLMSIIGLDNLDTSSVTEYDYMFTKTSLSIIDISNFENLDIPTTTVRLMFDRNPYLQTVVLPTNFNLKRAYGVSGSDTYYFGLASYPVSAWKDGVTINSDEDFFKLSATSQGGTWTRDISGSAELRFNVNKITRDGNSAEMQYTYYTSSATGEVYLKETSQSSFPSTPSDTFSIEGTGTGSMALTLLSDSAYDVMVKVYGGKTTLYTYPSIDSNVLLFSVDEDGNVEASGEVTDGNGNVLSNMVAKSILLDFCHPVGTYYYTDDADFDPNDSWGGTWSLLGEGQVLLSGSASGSYRVGTQYGDNTTSLEIANMPAHNHNSKSLTGIVTAQSWNNATPSGIVSSKYTNFNLKSAGSGTQFGTHNQTIDATHTHDTQGSGTAFSIMQKSRAVYIWHRTA